MIHQANKVRIGPVVEHNKAGVNRKDSALVGDVNGIGMTAKIVLLFEQSDLIAAL